MSREGVDDSQMYRRGDPDVNRQGANDEEKKNVLR
jgi:hypothetical protein